MRQSRRTCEAANSELRDVRALNKGMREMPPVTIVHTEVEFYGIE